MFPNLGEMELEAVNLSDKNTANTSSTQLTTREKMDLEYLRNRDPLKEFFTLTCQSVKLNSPHLNMILNIKSDLLYDKAQTEGVLFYKYMTWIETTI